MFEGKRAVPFTSQVPYWYRDVAIAEVDPAWNPAKKLSRLHFAFSSPSLFSWAWGLRCSGTENRVKGFWAGLFVGLAERPEGSLGDCFGHEERVSPQHIDVLVQERGKTAHVFIADCIAFRAQLSQGRFHIEGVPEDDHV